MKNVNIELNEVTRVEGHGNISVRLEDGEIIRLELQIIESPRFFESFMRGRHYSEAPHIACRICGICSVGHTTASMKAVEAACGIQPTDQTILLRKLLLYGEELQSHFLHLYFLSVPDYLGVGSVIPLIKTHQDVVQRALRMKRLANDICAVVGGRHIHPIAMHVGGVTHIPREDELRGIRDRLVASREDLRHTVELFGQLKVPDLHRDTEYVSLKATSNGEYAFYDGEIVSTLDKKPTRAADYRKRVIERVVEHSSAKHCRTPLSATYAVGALARFNNNHGQLHDAARHTASELGLRAPCNNPFHNNTAQLVETVHCVETSIELIEGILQRDLNPEPLVQPTRMGSGVGLAEVPRGLLIHEYGVDANGKIEDANLIIPTGQNLANIEEDMRVLVREMVNAEMTRDEMTLQLEMLVRAYDPCISCATHFLDVEWV